jgi:hypothetical protein
MIPRATANILEHISWKPHMGQRLNRRCWGLYSYKAVLPVLSGYSTPISWENNKLLCWWRHHSLGLCYLKPNSILINKSVPASHGGQVTEKKAISEWKWLCREV